MENLIGTVVVVLEQGEVMLQDVMPRPEISSLDLAVVNAARVSYLGDSKGEEADKKLLFYLMRNRHTTPFEMVEFKFRIKAPLVVWWQWVRHRTWSFNMQSGRYTEFDESAYHTPRNWRTQSKSNKQASDGEIDRRTSIELRNMLEDHYESSYKMYQYALSKGVAREQARFFLPGFITYYEGIVKTDAHNLMHFLRLRRHQHAQEEIRRYADVIYKEFFKPLMPWTAEAMELYEWKQE